MRDGEPARLSNCGDLLRASTTAPVWKHDGRHQGNDLGHGKNVEDWIIRSQVLRALQVYGCSSTTRWQSVRARILSRPGLKIESARPEKGPEEERPNQPGALGCLSYVSTGMEHAYHRD